MRSTASMCQMHIGMSHAHDGRSISFEMASPCLRGHARPGRDDRVTHQGRGVVEYASRSADLTGFRRQRHAHNEVGVDQRFGPRIWSVLASPYASRLHRRQRMSGVAPSSVLADLGEPKGAGRRIRLLRSGCSRHPQTVCHSVTSLETGGDDLRLTRRREQTCAHAGDLRGVPARFHNASGPSRRASRRVEEPGDRSPPPHRSGRQDRSSAATRRPSASGRCRSRRGPCEAHPPLRPRSTVTQGRGDLVRQSAVDLGTIRRGLRGGAGHERQKAQRPRDGSPTRAMRPVALLRRSPAGPAST